MMGPEGFEPSTSRCLLGYQPGALAMLSYGPLKYLRIYVLSFTRFGASWHCPMLYNKVVNYPVLTGRPKIIL